MKNLRFLPFNKSPKGQQDPPTTKQTAVNKRREQLRKAQRTYRERKEEYVKSLELEMVRMRANEANLMQETRRLYAEVGNLRNLLAQHGIPLPPTTHAPPEPDMPHFQDDSVSTLFVGQSLKEDGRQIHVHRGSRSSGKSTLTSSQSGSDAEYSSPPHHQRDQDDWVVSSIFTTTSNDPATSHSLTVTNQPRGTGLPPQVPKKLIAELDQTTIGMEFVLTLEGPCLGHIQGDPKKPHELTGHALTASAPLLLFSTATSASTLETPSWQAPTAILDRLLNLSKTLDLEDEVSPIQAWNYLRQHPKFSVIEVDQLRRLTIKLLAEISCHGFGAVVEKTVFESIVFDQLVAF